MLTPTVSPNPIVLNYSTPTRPTAFYVPVAVLAIIWGLYCLYFGGSFAFAVFQDYLNPSLRHFNLSSYQWIIIAINPIAALILPLAGIFLLCQMSAARTLLVVWGILVVLVAGVSACELYINGGFSRSDYSAQHATRLLLSHFVNRVIPATLAFLAARAVRFSNDNRALLPFQLHPATRAIAVLGIIWGAVCMALYGWMCLGMIAVMSTTVPYSPYSQPSPIVHLKTDPIFVGVVLGGPILALAMSALLLTASSMRLSRHRSAPGLQLRWAIAWLIVQALSFIGVYFVLGLMLRTSNTGRANRMELPNCISQIGWDYFSILLNLALPILIFVYHRQNSREQQQQQ